MPGGMHPAQLHAAARARSRRLRAGEQRRAEAAQADGHDGVHVRDPLSPAASRATPPGCDELQEDYADCWAGLREAVRSDPARMPRTVSDAREARQPEGRAVTAASSVVSRDLTRAAGADRRSPRHCRLPWTTGPQRSRACAGWQRAGIGRGRRAFPFDEARCASPLPRAYQWARRLGLRHPRRAGQEGAQGASCPARSGPIR